MEKKEGLGKFCEHDGRHNPACAPGVAFLIHLELIGMHQSEQGVVYDLYKPYESGHKEGRRYMDLDKQDVVHHFSSVRFGKDSRLRNMSLFNTIWLLLGVNSLVMAILFIVGRRIRNMGTVDLGWCGGLTLSAWILLLAQGSSFGWRSVLGTILLSLWGLRLFSFILLQRTLGREEDGRYKNLRSHWGVKADRNFFWLFYQAQALLVLVFLLPLFSLHASEIVGFRWWDGVGILIWLLSVFGESLADRQLARWRAQPENRGKTLQRGLWKYSRHPNYFFEWLHWFTYVFLSVGSPLFLLSVTGPVLMFFFLYRVTGIPHTERQALSSRPDYAEYKNTTSAFFPWPPKTNA